MIQLGEYTFEIPAPAAMRTFALQQRILPVAGRVIGALLHVAGAADFDPKKLGDMDVAKLLPTAAPLLGEIFSAMPPGELETLTRELLRDAKVSGWGGAQNVALFTASGGAFDAVMAGRTLDTWKLLFHALEVWYPDFLSLAAGLSGKGQKEKPSEK